MVRRSLAALVLALSFAAPAVAQVQHPRTGDVQRAQDAMERACAPGVTDSAANQRCLSARRDLDQAMRGNGAPMSPAPPPSLAPVPPAQPLPPPPIPDAPPPSHTR